MTSAILHHSALFKLHVAHGVPLLLVHCTAAIMMSPNESESHTIAGTNASPTNSLIVNVSLSSPIIAHPATNWNVKRGENMAYTQSLIALTSSMTARASTSTQNTTNMMALTSEVCTSCTSALATSIPPSSLVALSNLNIE